MNANQIYSIVNSALSQSRGAAAVSVTDTSDLMSLGNTMFQEGWQNDFLSALTDVIGKTIIVNRPYSSRVKGIIKDYFTFGAALRKLDVEPLEAEGDQSWTWATSSDPDGIGGTNDGYQAGIFIIKKPTVTQSLYVNMSVWDFEVTVPDVQLRSAFHSAEEMAAFVDAIMTALNNSITESVDAVARLVYATFAAIRIAETFGTGATQTLAINLLEDYNTKFADVLTAPLTADVALGNTDFIKYATNVINLTSKRMQDMSLIYNSQGKKRFTPKENQVLTLNSDFVTAYESYLQADTYHNEMVKLGEYEEVNFWQGSGTAYGDNTDINVLTPAFAIASETAAEHTVSATGVIGMLTDDRTLGVTVYDRYSAVERDNLKRIAQYKEAANIGFYIDRGENGVVFFIADDDPEVDDDSVET